MAARVAARFGLTLELVDMNSDESLIEQFSLRVPVVLDLDGNVLAEGNIEEVPLRRAVRRLAWRTWLSRSGR